MTDKKIVFATTDGRSETVSLEFPIVVDGVTVSNVTVRRMTAGEVADFQRRYKDASPEDRAAMRLPMFDQPGDVMAALDVDDADKIDAVADRFLPRRFLEASEPD